MARSWGSVAWSLTGWKTNAVPLSLQRTLTVMRDWAREISRSRQKESFISFFVSQEKKHLIEVPILVKTAQNSCPLYRISSAFCKSVEIASAGARGIIGCVSREISRFAFVDAQISHS